MGLECVHQEEKDAAREERSSGRDASRCPKVVRDLRVTGRMETDKERKNREAERRGEKQKIEPMNLKRGTKQRRKKTRQRHETGGPPRPTTMGQVPRVNLLSSFSGGSGMDWVTLRCLLPRS